MDHVRSAVVRRDEEKDMVNEKNHELNFSEAFS